MCWIDIYLGLPNIIMHNVGKNFISKEFKQYASAMRINIKGVLVKAYNLISIVEQYYGLI